MAQINMNGKQSFLLNDIKTSIRNGENVTHILNVKVSQLQQPNAEIGNRIRQRIYSAIANVPITKIVNNQSITLTWRTAATTTSAYFHCDAGFFNDLAVKMHTKALLSGLLGALNASFNNIFANGVTGLAFLVTKPLTRPLVLVDDDVLMSEPEDEELDEAEENN